MTQIGKYPTTFYRVSLKAYIRDENGHVLVCKEGRESHWSLPGGGLEHGETEKECLERELYEELGYDGELQYRPIATKVFDVPGIEAQVLWIVYDVTLEDYTPKPGENCTAAAYIDPNDFESSTYGTKLQAQAAIYELSKQML